MEAAWSKVAPHRPLGPGASEYALRPEGSGAELAALVRAGWRRIAMVGPMGVGKSTELAAAQQSLAQDRFVSRIGVDLSFDMRKIHAGEVFAHILERFVGARQDRSLLATLNVAGDFVADGEARDLRRDLARKALRAAGNAVLLVDGLEKAEQEPARAVAEELFALGDDADIVIVVPASLAYGPVAVLLAEDVRLFPVRPVPVWGSPRDEAVGGRLFLREVALRHLAEEHPDGSLVTMVDRACVVSGGVPRALLQLLRDAHRHAVVARRSMPNLEDMQRAERDHGEQLRRALLPGDLDVLKRAEGSDGSEVPLDRRLRFLLQGHLLEYRRADRIVVHMAPTLAAELRFPQDLVQDLP